ncbi:MAG: hypothetical protein QXZ66_09465 [Thermoproteota archaeon]
MTVYVFTVLRYLRAKRETGELLFENDFLTHPRPIGETVKWGFGPLKQETFFQTYPRAEFEREIRFYLQGASSVETWRRYVLLEQRSRIELIMKPEGRKIDYIAYTPIEIFPNGSCRILSPPRTAFSVELFIDWHEKQMLRGFGNAFEKNLRLSSRY